MYAQLTDEAAGKTWFTSLQGGAAIENAATVINGKLADKTIVDRALVWNSGMTYYYKEIMHLNGLNGVVRNHIYGVNVQKIAGLGTPVYKPDEIIYPETPEEMIITSRLKSTSCPGVLLMKTMNWCGNIPPNARRRN